MNLLNRMLVLLVLLNSGFGYCADNLMWLTVQPDTECDGAPHLTLSSQSQGVQRNWTTPASYDPACPSRGESVLLSLHNDDGSIYVQLRYRANKRVDVLDADNKQLATLFVQDGSVAFSGMLLSYSTMVNPKKRRVAKGWIYGSDVYVFNASDSSQYLIEDSHLATVANVTRIGNETEPHVLQINYTGIEAMPLAMDPRISVAVAIARDFDWSGHADKPPKVSQALRITLLTIAIAVPTVVATTVLFLLAVRYWGPPAHQAATTTLARCGSGLGAAYFAARSAVMSLCNWRVLDDQATEGL